MAEQSIHDVVNQEQSVGDHSPSDVSATKTNHQASGGEGEEDQAAEKNGFGSQTHPGTGTFETKEIELGSDIVSNGLPEVCLSVHTLLFASSS